MVSVAPNGAPGNSEPWATDLTPDGRYVAFYSRSSNLVPGDTNYVKDAFVHRW